MQISLQVECVTLLYVEAFSEVSEGKVWPSEHAERHHFVVRVVADVGPTEKRNAGAFAPVTRDVLAGRAEIGIVAGNVGHPPKADPCEPTQLRLRGDVEQRAIGA